jgi:hypothetical protein
MSYLIIIGLIGQDEYTQKLFWKCFLVLAALRDVYVSEKLSLDNCLDLIDKDNGCLSD